MKRSEFLAGIVGAPVAAAATVDSNAETPQRLTLQTVPEQISQPKPMIFFEVNKRFKTAEDEQRFYDDVKSHAAECGYNAMVLPLGVRVHRMF